jgi:hypothetical protein
MFFSYQATVFIYPVKFDKCPMEDPRLANQTRPIFSVTEYQIRYPRIKKIGFIVLCGLEENTKKCGGFTPTCPTPNKIFIEQASQRLIKLRVFGDSPYSNRGRHSGGAEFWERGYISEYS